MADSRDPRQNLPSPSESAGVGAWCCVLRRVHRTAVVLFAAAALLKALADLVDELCFPAGDKPDTQAQRQVPYGSSECVCCD